jgi:hypothetical protein
MRQLAVLAVVILSLAAPAVAQGPPDAAKILAAQREAMAKLSMLDGMWRGPASTLSPSGGKYTITQTERVGPFLDGTIKVIEGRGYEADGSVGFNAFATISYNPSTQTYTMHSHSQGQVGGFVLTPTADGFSWEIPAGPMSIRYVATVKGGTWREVGDRVMPGSAPARFFEMTLQRIGDTDWPAGGAVPPK